MEKLNYVKYAVIAAGIIVSAAFYVLGGDGGALLGEAGDSIMLEYDSGSEGSGSAAAGTVGAFLSGWTDGAAVADGGAAGNGILTGSDEGRAAENTTGAEVSDTAARRLDAVISENGELTQAFKSQLEDIVKAAVREELTAICEEGYLEEALSEAAQYATAEAEARKDMVNINTASLEELMTLTGIGEKRAGDIIAYREITGGFSDISQLMEVSGIKQSSYDKIKDKIYV